MLQTDYLKLQQLPHYHDSAIQEALQAALQAYSQMTPNILSQLKSYFESGQNSQNATDKNSDDNFSNENFTDMDARSQQEYGTEYYKSPMGKEREIIVSNSPENLTLKDQFVWTYYEDLVHRKKRMDKAKAKYDRLHKELTKSSLQIKILEKKIQQTSTKSNPIRIQKSKYHLSQITFPKFRLDVGIIHGYINGNQIQEFKSSFGQNSLYYSITQGIDMFESEKTSNNIQQPQWKETFTFTLENGEEVLLFELFRHNSSESHLQIDQFEVRVADVLESLSDQANHQIACVSEKDNAFDVAMRWRYDDSASKIAQLKKKIRSLKDIMLKYEDLYKKAQANFEQLSKFGGDYRQLLDNWGIIKNLNYSLPSEREQKPKKKPLGRISKSGSRSSSKVNESVQSTSKNQVGSGFHSRTGSFTKFIALSGQVSQGQTINFNNMTKGHSSIRHQKNGLPAYPILQKQDSEQLPPRIIHNGTKGFSMVNSPKSPPFILRTQTQAMKANTHNMNSYTQSPQKVMSDIDESEFINSPTVFSNTTNDFPQESVPQHHLVYRQETLKSNVSQHSNSGIGGGKTVKIPLKLRKCDQTQAPAPSSRNLVTTSSNSEDKEAETTDTNTQHIPKIQASTISFSMKKVNNKVQSSHRQMDFSASNNKQSQQPVERRQEEEFKPIQLTSTKSISAVTQSQYVPQVLKNRAQNKNVQHSEFSGGIKQEEQEQVAPEVTGSVYFEESRKEKLQKLAKQEPTISFGSMKDVTQTTLSFQVPGNINYENQEQQTPKLRNEEPPKIIQPADKNDLDANNQDYIDELQKEIGLIMQSAEEEKKERASAPAMQTLKVQNKNNVKAHSGFLGSELLKPRASPIRDSSVLLNGSKISHEVLQKPVNTSGSFNNEHFKSDELSHIGFETGSNDKEILEPTLANLKRLELRNQRRGIEQSIVSSSINQIINGQNPGLAKSVNKLGSERSFGSQGNAGLISMKPTAKLGGSQFKFGSMRNQMFGFGSGIGMMLKSMDQGSLIGQHVMNQRSDQ